MVGEKTRKENKQPVEQQSKTKSHAHTHTRTVLLSLVALSLAGLSETTQSTNIHTTRQSAAAKRDEQTKTSQHFLRPPQLFVGFREENSAAIIWRCVQVLCVRVSGAQYRWPLVEW